MDVVQFSKPPERVLIVKPSAIGDVVHALPLLGLLRAKWPGIKMSWLVTPGCAGLVEGHPLVDEVIRFERGKWAQAWWRPSALKELRAFFKTLRERQFDLVLDLQGLLRSGIFTFATRAKVRVGFANAREGANWFYTHRVEVGTTEQHAIDRYLTLGEAVGLARGPIEFVLPITEEDRARVREKLIRAGVNGEYAVYVPGTNWETKRWPAGEFAALAKLVWERRGMDGGLTGVLAGSGGEKAIGRAVMEAYAAEGGNAAALVNLVGETTLREMIALIEGAALVVANDSGPMHIATALGRPLVTLFGPTNPVRTGPYQRAESVVRLEIACSPCYSRTCSHRSCLQWLKAEQVAAAAGIVDDARG